MGGREVVMTGLLVCWAVFETAVDRNGSHISAPRDALDSDPAGAPWTWLHRPEHARLVSGRGGAVRSTQAQAKGARWSDRQRWDPTR
jgi:hypothetical protein